MTISSKVIVALPAYNEEKYIASVVSKTTKYADIVVALDDGSTDDTAWEAMGAGAQVEYHHNNKGYGATIQSILDFARKENPDVLVIMDADNQHSPDDIPALVKAIRDGYDLAIGRRASKDVPFYRRAGGTTLSVFTYLLSGFWVRDSQCGFRAYSRRAVELIKPRENGMAVSSEIVALATWSGLRIIEVPISVRYTDDSSTHNPWKQGFYTLWRILVMLFWGKVMDADDWILTQTTYALRITTHWMRMKQIRHGRDWRFYSQYSIKEILQMKLDGTEEDKYWIWLHRRR